MIHQFCDDTDSKGILPETLFSGEGGPPGGSAKSAGNPANSDIFAPISLRVGRLGVPGALWTASDLDIFVMNDFVILIIRL